MANSFIKDDCIDDWLAIEVNDLRQQIEEVELQNIWLTESSEKAIAERKEMQATLSKERATFRDEASDMNKQITSKCVALSDLVDEYQLVLDQYVFHTHVKLNTQKLEELRKRGGYI